MINDTILIKAVRDNNLELVEHLMTTNFEEDKRICDDAKKTALSWSVADGHLEIFKLFLKKEFRKYFNVKNDTQPMFEEVIKNRDIKMVDFFINNPILKKHINWELGIKKSLILQDSNMIQFLTVDCKFNINPYIETIKNDKHFIYSYPYVKNFLDYYDLKKEIDNHEVKVKKVKI